MKWTQDPNGATFPLKPIEKKFALNPIEKGETRDGTTLHIGTKNEREGQIKEAIPANRRRIEVKMVVETIEAIPYVTKNIGVDRNGNYYSVSQRDIDEQQYQLNEARGAAIRGGVFGSLGSLVGGTEGALKGSVIDGVAMSFAGVETPYGKVEPVRPVELPFEPTIEMPKGVDPKSLVRTERGISYNRSTEIVANYMTLGVKRIDVFRYNNKNYIIDGHHNTEAAIRLHQNVELNYLSSPGNYSNVFELQDAAYRATEGKFKVDGRYLKSLLKK